MQELNKNSKQALIFMADQNLVKYIKDSLSSQVPRQDIEKSLLGEGWEKPQIEEAFGEVDKIEEPPQKHGLKFGLSIAVVVICLVAAGLAVYWIRTEPVEENTNVIYNTKPENEIADWQTYRNEEYGFEVKLPDISINYYDNSDVPTSDKNAVFGIGLAKYEFSLIEYTLIIYNEDINAISQRILKENQDAKREKIVVAGMPAERLTYNNMACGEGESSCSPVISTNTLIEHSGRVYEFWLLDKEDNGYYDQILSTFKFIEPSNLTGFIQYGKTIKGNGIEASFEDGILSYSTSSVVFSPKDRIIIESGKEQAGVPEDIYTLDIGDYRIANTISHEASTSPLNTKKPVIKNINGLNVVESADGGFCDTRFAEVVGKTHNYIFSSLGCHHDEKTDFASFEKVIATMKFIDQ